MVHTGWQVMHRLTFINKELTTWRLLVQHSATHGTEKWSRLWELMSALRAPCATYVAERYLELRLFMGGHGLGTGSTERAPQQAWGGWITGNITGDCAAKRTLTALLFLDFTCWKRKPSCTDGVGGKPDNHRNRLPATGIIQNLCGVLLLTPMLYVSKIPQSDQKKLN